MGEPRWRVAVTGLYRYYGPHLNVVFSGSVGPNKDTVIAVDDIFVTLEMCSPIISVACSFVNTTCLWTNDPDSLQWIAADSYSDQSLNGPADDKDPYHYVMFDIVPHHRPGDSARLVSPTLTRTYMTTSICFNFNFAACCEHGGILSVIMVDIGNNNETLLWQLPITRDYAESQWQLGRVEIKNPPENYALVMQGEVWDGREGYLALKDFHLTESEYTHCSLVPESATPEPPSILPPATILPLLVDPKSSLDCDFEDASHPSCGFIDEGDVGYWLRVNASSPPNVFNPIIDNTLKNDSGHYLTAQFPYAGLNEKAVQLRTPALNSSIDYCLTFFLHHVGNNPPPLIVKAEVLAGPLHVELLRRDYPLQDMWVLVEREVQAGIVDGPYAITINAMMKQAQEGDVSIDDLKESFVVVESRCPKEDDMSCSFTLGLCGFMQEETKDDLDWLWHDATGPDDPYLPMETKAHDYYIYLNTSSFKGSSAVIYSTEYRLSGPHCATFDVHLHSELHQTALLQVLDIGEGTIEDGVLLLNKQNDLGYDWATLQIPLEPSMKPFRLAFRGIIGDMDQTHSTFALDNIKLTPGACNAPASCSFEDGLCGWVNEELDLDWELAGPEDLSLATRPYADATQRNHNGGFLYVEAEEHLLHSAATLRSQIFPPIITENCLTFWYHIYGARATRLSARVQVVKNEDLIPVWNYLISISRWDTGWNYASAPFSSKYKFRLHIEAYLGSDFMGDVAVDDIVVASGGCAIIPEEAGEGVTYVSPAPHTRTEVQPFTAAPGPDVHDCTFEQDLCSWSSSMSEVRTGLQTQAHRNLI
ncbi:MAM and LDL-receptor class A domain-containing protein 1 [Chionoecetes opilio]|uniref:MAM and LDL-receptor class A domain-containing protein 1 n=1 Tax=Chionoecetes opilio TaxID=41210 RepID=A0A8J5D3A5_CHIOP|nr:MAM and LDL-receptor class A domain-containing protein 1 [Chionoecetes opilio]